MAEERSGFFDSTIIDGKYVPSYGEVDFSKYFSKFLRSGVHIDPANQLMVTAAGGLMVSIRAGWAIIDGYWYELRENKTLTLPLNEGAVTKRYYVICVLNRTAGNITTTYREVDTDENPVNDGNVHELILASFSLGTGTSVLTDSMITDHRPDRNYCGYVSGIGDSIDTTGIFQQFQNAYDIWFRNVKDNLSQDAAGNLLQQIESVNDDLQNFKSGIPNVLRASLISNQYRGNIGEKKIGARSSVNVRYEQYMPFTEYGKDRLWLCMTFCKAIRLANSGSSTEVVEAIANINYSGYGYRVSGGENKFVFSANIKISNLSDKEILVNGIDFGVLTIIGVSGM